MYEKSDHQVDRVGKIHSLQKDLILTHGGGLRRDNGELYTHVKDRVDKSVQLFKDDYSPRIVMSDGMGAKRMREYAVKQGVNEDVILLEDKSSSTTENILFTLNRYMIPNNWKSLYMVSNYWHGPRITDKLIPKYLNSYDAEFVEAIDSRPDDDPMKRSDISGEKLKILSEDMPPFMKKFAKKILGK